jgi:hypothetical protein
MVAANPAAPTIDPNTRTHTVQDQPVLDAREILAAFLDPSQSLFDILDEFNLSINELHAWLARPEIAAALAKLLEMHALRNRVLAAQSSAAALETIAAIARGQPPQGLSAETARKSASHILRLAAPPKPPRPARRACTSDAPTAAAQSAHTRKRPEHESEGQGVSMQTSWATDRTDDAPADPSIPHRRPDSITPDHAPAAPPLRAAS